MKRKLLAILLCLMAFCSLCGCSIFAQPESSQNASCTLEYVGETRVAIVAETDGVSVLSCMESLQNELTFELSDGMLISLNGKANAADYSSCWMLYTTDETMSNSAWGTIEYEGKTLASAAFGADALMVKKGEIYLWEYVTF